VKIYLSIICRSDRGLLLTLQASVITAILITRFFWHRKFYFLSHRLYLYVLCGSEKKNNDYFPIQH